MYTVYRECQNRCVYRLCLKVSCYRIKDPCCMYPRVTILIACITSLPTLKTLM
ncbi:unnamed protein product [Moneuplotes crassus]|uniref:Uncharacterized protein n=1 Tax=Euplotes crassus TaxID=5936 RepID=A0AAD2CV82_EUPCR|nr:unnamed protein product [Moneuplotes crassus]